MFVRGRARACGSGSALRRRPCGDPRYEHLRRGRLASGCGAGRSAFMPRPAPDRALRLPRAVVRPMERTASAAPSAPNGGRQPGAAWPGSPGGSRPALLRSVAPGQAFQYKTAAASARKLTNLADLLCRSSQSPCWSSPSGSISYRFGSCSAGHIHERRTISFHPNALRRT